MDQETSAAIAGVLSNLAKQYNPVDERSFSGQVVANGAKLGTISLPGPDTVARETLEKELSALALRIQFLEFKATTANGQNLPITPNEPPIPPSNSLRDNPRRISHTHGRSSSDTKRQRSAWVETLLSPKLSDSQQRKSDGVVLTQEQQQNIHEAFMKQEEEIRNHKATIQSLDTQVAQLEGKIDDIKQFGNQDIENLQRELTKSQQANSAFQKALREIENIVTAVADGDLSKKVLIHAKEMDPSIATFKRTINKMVDQLQAFAYQVTHLAREVGTEGRLGGQAVLPDVSGIWLELTTNVNVMAKNLTDQVREIAVVTTAVAQGDLSQKITRPAKGEILQLQQTINVMVDQLRTFATEVIRVARDVGTEGVLGGQAKIEGVQGTWNDLTTDVNAMANNLTTQVRDIAEVTTAVAKGDLTRKVKAQCKGEILELKSTINSMVDQLQAFAHEVTKLAREVGTEGRLGGQATVHGVEGTWKDLTENVNGMANNLTTQVREIAEVTTAVAKGDLSKKVTANVQGEILALKITINSMVDRLSTFAFEVSKVAREVGTEGTLGGQARVENVEGKWKDLTDNVNTMAENLTDQVRSISDVTQAIARGDMSRKIHVHAQGEILLLKDTINDMVSRLDDWSLAVKRVSRDVGVDGKMGGQASTEGLAGRWKDITLDVNTMAMNLTSQVRAFSDITNAANVGDFTQKITIAASGEMDELKRKLNTMVSGLRESIEKNTKARQDAEQANKTKSEFLANMSHEIRTPMNGIIGMTQLTLDTDLNNYQRDMLNIVSNLANSLLTIIDDILDISKIEANRMDLEEIPYSLRATVFNALKTLAVKANERYIDLSYQVDNPIPDYVVGDAFRLRQIILNLVGNALKFTEYGEVRVRISVTSQQSCGPNEYAILTSVTDTGIGIHGEKLNLIFDTFQQADGSTTRKFGGTGLGLSISKRLVNLMGGNMWVESEYGQGSTFHFTCKVRLAATDFHLIMPQLQPYFGHSVLFIDQGNTECAEEITAAVKQLGLVPVVIEVHENQEVIPLLREVRSSTCDCIIVDSNQTARILRTVEQFKYIPLVMLAPVIAVSFKSALEDGITSYMTTPCTTVDLCNALLPALEGRATPSVSDLSRSFEILLAEDNAVNQRLAVKILEKYNHKVTVANNGLEAFEAVKAKRYDAVLMDVQMPIMGGFEATAKIREHEAKHKLSRTPIVALTAHAMLGDREKCIQAQMDDYLSKPLKQNQLIQTILKCATMGGAMLEHKNKTRRSVIDHQKDASESKSVRHVRPPLGPVAKRRPTLENRGFTDVATGAESPTLDPEQDPMDVLVLRSHSS